MPSFQAFKISLAHFPTLTRLKPVRLTAILKRVKKGEQQSCENDKLLQGEIFVTTQKPCTVRYRGYNEINYQNRIPLWNYEHQPFLYVIIPVYPCCSTGFWIYLFTMTRMMSCKQYTARVSRNITTPAKKKKKNQNASTKSIKSQQVIQANELNHSALSSTLQNEFRTKYYEKNNFKM